jgi:hypothetical protein
MTGLPELVIHGKQLEINTNQGLIQIRDLDRERRRKHLRVFILDS